MEISKYQMMLGIFLVLLGAYFVYVKRSSAQCALIVVPGVLMCLAGNPDIISAQLEAFGIKANLNREVKQQVLNATIAAKTDDIGPLRQEIQKINDALKKQDEFNNSVVASINKINSDLSKGQTAVIKLNPADINTVSASFKANSVYSVIVFYRIPRSADAQSLVKKLSAAGFQASSVETDLVESPIGLKPDNSTFIIPTARAATVAETINKIVHDALPPAHKDAVTLDDSSDRRKGDAQVFMY